jgi:uncharacterized protein YbaA (DUF1428 family)
MPRYVDGFVIPLPKKNLAAYRKMAKIASQVWRDHGALQYVEAIGEDLKTKFGLPFPRIAKTRPGETVVFAWIMYKSRKHRDKVNALVMNDPRLGASMNVKKMPFDVKRMAYGGFDVLIES